MLLAVISQSASHVTLVKFHGQRYQFYYNVSNILQYLALQYDIAVTATFDLADDSRCVVVLLVLLVQYVVAERDEHMLSSLYIELSTCIVHRKKISV